MYSATSPGLITTPGNPAGSTTGSGFGFAGFLNSGRPKPTTLIVMPRLFFL